jgi:hypothetical protein
MTALLVLALLISAAVLLVVVLRDADARALALDLRPWGQLVAPRTRKSA